MHRATQKLLVAQTWDGLPAPRQDWVKVELALGAYTLSYRFDAPFHGDEPPPGPSGPTPGLWNHEVVELFLLGEDDHYLELELGPHGHYLALELLGRRQVIREHTGLDYQVQHQGARFMGQAEIPLHWLPAGVARLNAYAIFGPAEARQHLAWRGAPGPRPDFHRLETFGKLGLSGFSSEVTVPSARAAGANGARERARGRA